MARTRRKQTEQNEPTPESAAVGSSMMVPNGYAELLIGINQRIAAARVKAALAVNRELIQLYWDIGRLIVERQQREGWGKGVIEQLGRDIQSAFPGIEGFSARNLWRMRSFYLAYCEQLTALSQRAAELAERPALPAMHPERPILPQAAAEIPWFHNVVLIEKVKDTPQRLWYAQRTIEHGWSRAVLVHQIESGLYHRQGRAITNFERTLPAPQSDLARQLLKDPYTFEKQVCLAPRNSRPSWRPSPPPRRWRSR